MANDGDYVCRVQKALHVALHLILLSSPLKKMKETEFKKMNTSRLIQLVRGTAGLLAQGFSLKSFGSVMLLSSLMWPLT